MGLSKYSFSCAKAAVHSSFHLKLLRRVQKNGKHLSVDRDMNRLKAMTFSMSPYISCFMLGGFSCMIVCIFSGSASMSLFEIRNPRNFPEDTLKAHLVGLSFIQY